MFRAEILWLANGPILKMDGKLVGDWAEQAVHARAVVDRGARRVCFDPRERAAPRLTVADDTPTSLAICLPVMR